MTAWNPAWDTKAVASPTIDYFIALGAALDQVGRTLYANSNIKLVVQNGVITVWDGDLEVRRIGTRDCELTVDDWQMAAARIAAR